MNPDELDEVAANVAAIYREAEVALGRIIARHLAGEIDDDIEPPAWAERKLAAVGALRRSAQSVAAALQNASEGAVRDAAAAAFRAGWRSALAELPAEWFPASGLGDAATAAAEDVPGFAAIEALASAVSNDIGQRARNILRDVLDVYRDVISGTVARTLTGVQTRRQASQAAWRKLTDRGITGFTDRSGRRWQLASYVEMATRTVTQRAAVAGQTDRLNALGVPLVYVSDHAQECALCRPFEGRVLSLTGPTGDITVPHELTDEPITVHVTATLAEAQLRGLHHPNCRHSVSAYLPGVTRPPPQPTADPDGDRARQKQRAIERKIRRHKLAEAAALDDDGRRAARRKVRAAQAEMRDHLAEHPNLKRLRYREQIGAGNVPPRGRDDAAGGIGPITQPPLDGGAALRVQRERLDDALDELVEQHAEDPDQLDLLTADPEPEPEPQPADAAPLDLTAWTDDDLDVGVAEYAEDANMLDAILAEMDRRQAAEQDDAEPFDDLADFDDDPDAEKWAEVDRLAAEGMDYEEAYAEVFEKDVERLRRDEAIRQLREDGYTGGGFDELARAAYRDALDRDYFAAEDATRGFMLTAEGQRKGLDPRNLWRQNEAYARRWASDELKQWWDDNGRLTFDEFRAALLSGGNEERFRTGGESWLQ